MSKQQEPYKTLSQFTSATIRAVVFLTLASLMIAGPLFRQFQNKDIPLLPAWDSLLRHGDQVCVVEIRTSQGFPLPRGQAFQQARMDYEVLITDPTIAEVQVQQLANRYPELTPLRLFVAQANEQGRWEQVISGKEFHAAAK